MNAIRRALRERLTGGGVILSLVYLLVLQSLLASMAQGTLAAMPSSSQVICTSDGLFTRDAPASQDDPAGALLRWHCATLCEVASAGGPAVIGPAAEGIRAPWPEAVRIPPAPAAIGRPAFERSLAEARAPPSSI